jgi:hypothetical protein
MWAGYLALANQLVVANGSPPLGFINPALYGFGLGSSYNTVFHDITSGNNGDPATSLKEVPLMEKTDTLLDP